MTEEPNEKAEKAQFEGIIKNDRLILSDREAIDDIYFNSYIGWNDFECLGCEFCSNQ